MNKLSSSINEEEVEILNSLARENSVVYGMSSKYLKIMDQTNYGWYLIYCDGVYIRSATGELVHITVKRQPELNGLPWDLSCREWTIKTVDRDAISPDYPNSFINLHHMWILGSVEIHEIRYEFDDYEIQYDESIVFRSKNQDGRAVMLNSRLFNDYSPDFIIGVSNNSHYIGEKLDDKYLRRRWSSG